MRRFVGEHHAAVRQVLTMVTAVVSVGVVVLGMAGALTSMEIVLGSGVVAALVTLSVLSPGASGKQAGSAFLGLVFVTGLWSIQRYGFGPVQAGHAVLTLLLTAYASGRVGVVIVSSMTLLVAANAGLAGEPQAMGPVVEGVAAISIFGIIVALLWVWLGADEQAQVVAQRRADAMVGQDSRYAELVRNAPDGVLAMRLDGRVDAISPAMTRMTGYREANMLGRLVWDLPFWREGAAEALRAHVQDVLTGERCNGVVLSFRSLDTADSAWFEARIRLVRRSDGLLALNATFRDVSDRERAEQARAAYEQGLKQAERVEFAGRLAGGIAHNFNNLLAVISTNAELMSLREELADLEELQDLRAAATIGTELTQKLMALTRNHRMEIEALDVAQVLERIRPVLRRLLPTSIHLDVEVAADVPLVAAGHAHVEQLLVNLVVNARDAIAGGGRVSIEVGSSHGEGADLPWVRIDVHDTGSGIAPEHHALVFEPFFSTKGSQGTGLGLASTLGVVEQLGGRVELTSAVGQGSTFTLHLPSARPQERAERGVPRLEEQARYGTILLVEDEDAVRRATRRCLQYLGYDVVAVRSVKRALEALERSMPDLVLSDVVMPEHNGVELLRAIRARTPGLPVVLMSAHSNVEGAEEADAFLAKPFTIDAAAAAMEQGRVSAQYRVDQLAVP